MEKLHAQIRYLEQENERLKSELLRAQQTVSTDAARGVGSRERASRRQIRSLEQKITDLNAVGFYHPLATCHASNQITRLARRIGVSSKGVFLVVMISHHIDYSSFEKRRSSGTQKN